MSDTALLLQVLKNQMTIMDALLDLSSVPGVTRIFMKPPIAERKSETTILLGGYNPINYPTGR